jgi:type VI secretion system secreted protein VgrG
MPELLVCHAISVEGWEAPLDVQEFDGVEGLSQLYHFEIAVRSEEPITFEDFIGKGASLTMQIGLEDPARTIHGIVTRIEQADTTEGWAGYRLTLVPKLFRLVHRADSRIFQAMTAPQVIQKVIAAAGFASGDDFALELRGTYAVREYCVQYRESDWDFICRLMEDEGIAFLFEQGATRAKLVLIDGVASYRDVPGEGKLRWRPPQGALGTVEHTDHLTRFSFSRELRPNKVTLRDYDFARPELSLEATKEGTTDTALEIYDYPGAYVEPAVGTTRAALRLEELHALSAVGEGDSSSVELAAGSVFALWDHPRESFNARYLLTRIEHRGFVPSAFNAGDFDAKDEEVLQQPPYRSHFEVIKAEVLFRPSRVTPKPAIHGAQTAVVVGPVGEKIHTDEHGRIKVQFFWDRLGKKDDKSSCWMRVSQIWAGPAWGAVFLPRIGHEVVITFLEGDPDRPLVVGSVYHGSNVPPYALPANKSRSTIKSDTVDASGGYNELRFEDAPGSEEVYFHAQKDSTIVVENDKNQSVKHDETLDVTNDRTKAIHHDQKERVDHDDTQEVGHDRSVKIENDSTLEVLGNRTDKVHKDDTETVLGKQTLAVTGDRTLTVGGAQSATIDGTRTLTVKGDATHAYQAALAVTVGAAFSQTIDAGATIAVTEALETTAKSSKLDVETTHVLSAGDSVKIECGSSIVTIKSDGTIEIQGKSLSVTCNGGDVKVSGVNVEVKAQANAKLEAQGQVSIKANGPVEVNSSAVVKVSGPMVSLG